MKFMGWLCKMVLVVLMVSSLTVFTTGMVVNAYIKSILDSFNIQLEGQPFAWGSMLQGMMGNKSSSTEETDSKTPVMEDKEPVIGSSTITKDLDSSNQDEVKENGERSPGSVKEDSPVVDEEVPEDALSVMGGIDSEASGMGEQDQRVVVTPDDVARKKDDLPASEKEEVFNILMTKLPQDKIQEITVAMENGLTEQELKQVEDIISKYLSKDEYNKLMTLLKS